MRITYSDSHRYFYLEQAAKSAGGGFVFGLDILWLQPQGTSHCGGWMDSDAYCCGYRTCRDVVVRVCAFKFTHGYFSWPSLKSAIFVSFALTSSSR